MGKILHNSSDFKMTLLVSWIGVDTHGTASAYIAADSRISWARSGAFDHGRKVFALRNSPDILGYCGDVLFPSIVLGQIVEMADSGLLLDSKTPCKERFEAIKEKLVQQFHRYPRMVITSRGFQVLHISRDPNDNSIFSCWITKWRHDNGWSGEEVMLPSHSGVLKALGSAAADFRRNLRRYEEGPDHGTSRCVFHCFCDTLFNTTDSRSGGAPQLVGIYRKPGSPGIYFGIIRDKQRYFLGASVGDAEYFAGLEWRNDLLERCDGKTMKRLADAQQQPDSLRRH